jgi:Right handed beta helix region
MNTLSTTIKALTCSVFILALCSLAQAQATRTWVSGVGDDVNPCSRTAPCKTYAGAISKTAANGEISTLDPGGFGAVTLTKSITIDGTNGAGYGSILAAGTSGVVVNDGATGSPNTITVRLRNLSINGAGTGVHGVNAVAFKRLYIENCAIAGFSSSSSSRGIRVSLNTAASPQVFIKDTVLSPGGATTVQGSGIDLHNAGGLLSFLIDNCRVEGYQGDGVILQSNANGEIRNTAISLNSLVGLKITAATSNVGLESCLIQQNGTGVSPVNGGTVVFSNTSVFGNSTGVATVAGSILTSHGNNQFTLNGGGSVPTSIGQQ